MTKYISDVQTVEEAGTTGIRITVSEDAGETTIRAVNTVEFENIESTLKKLQEEEVTTTKLEEYLKNYAKTSDLNNYAKTSDLNNYAKTSDLNNYAKTSELSKYVPIVEQLWVGRIKANSSGNWDYSTLAGMYGNYIEIAHEETVKHGFCLVIRAKGYNTSDIGQTIPANVVLYADTLFKNCTWNDYTCYQQSLNLTLPDGSSVTENCLVCPIILEGIPISEAKNVHGSITYNYRGRTITRLFEVTVPTNQKKGD